MRRLLERHPLLASLAAALLVATLGVAVLLPRTDAVEIADAVVGEPLAGSPPRVALDVRVRYRFGSATGGVLVVRVPAPDGRGTDAAARVELASRTGEVTVLLRVPQLDAVPVVAEIRPAGASDGLLGALLAGKRSDVRVVALERAAPGEPTGPKPPPPSR